MDADEDTLSLCGFVGSNPTPCMVAPGETQVSPWRTLRLAPSFYSQIKTGGSG